MVGSKGIALVCAQLCTYWMHVFDDSPVSSARHFVGEQRQIVPLFVGMNCAPLRSEYTVWPNILAPDVIRRSESRPLDGANYCMCTGQGVFISPTSPPLVGPSPNTMGRIPFAGSNHVAHQVYAAWFMFRLCPVSSQALGEYLGRARHPAVWQPLGYVLFLYSSTSVNR